MGRTRTIDRAAIVIRVARDDDFHILVVKNIVDLLLNFMNEALLEGNRLEF